VRTSRRPCASDGQHCCNYPVRCPAHGCRAVVWKYALLAHWHKEHAGQQWPEAQRDWFRLGPKERAFMEGVASKMTHLCASKGSQLSM
jgi:hypothetical protein